MKAQGGDQTIIGRTDGFGRGYIDGWAWYPNRPSAKVVVELLVNGEVVAEAIACLPRPDLETAGIGTGHYAFAIPFSVDPQSPSILRLAVRAKDGALLPPGEFIVETSPESRAEIARRRSIDHLESVFGPLASAHPPARRLPPPPPAPRLNFILYSAHSGQDLSRTLGMPEYSYYFVLRGFRELLRRLGTVHVVHRPTDADAIYDACLARAESCLLFSFAPPQSTQLGLRCPIVPVIAWEFNNIPTGGWGGDMRDDWRLVLRQTGRAITISNFAAQAIRAGMGADFPVAALPTPVWDRLSALRTNLAGPGAPAPGGPVSLHLEGIVWDSRLETLCLTMLPPPLPAAAIAPPARILPVRGAQLALALASAAERAQAQRAADELAQATAAAAAAAEEAAVADAKAARIEAIRLTPKSARQRAGVTVRLAAQWYREAVRDILPRPVTTGVSTLGRMARALRAPVLPPLEPVAAALSVRAEIEQPAASPEPAPQLLETTAAPSPDIDGDDIISTPAAAPDPGLPEPDLAVFSPDPMQAEAPTPRSGTSIVISGIVFTAVLSPKDGRKNWPDIVTAFIAAFTDTPEATLVLKMIGADATYWWWEFYSLARAFPPFQCRIIVLSGFLHDADYEALIAASHFVVNASMAEGQCLPLVEFMAGGTPAIAPRHTAMLDYIREENAVIVASGIEFCSWPHDPRNHHIVSRHRLEWPSLRESYQQAWRIAREDPRRYASMCAHAAASVRDYCADDVVGPALASFLGLGEEVVRRAGWQPRPAPVVEPMP